MLSVQGRLPLNHIFPYAQWAQYCGKPYSRHFFLRWIGCSVCLYMLYSLGLLNVICRFYIQRGGRLIKIKYDVVVVTIINVIAFTDKYLFFFCRFAGTYGESNIIFHVRSKPGIFSCKQETSLFRGRKQCERKFCSRYFRKIRC